MAQYGGTYLCGHKGLVNVIGKHSERQRKIDAAFSHVCPECAKIEREKKIAEENKRALELSVEYDFPKLSGTEKQVAWANTIRLKFYERNEDDKTMQKIIEKETKASFWLDLDRWINKSEFLAEYRKNEKKKEHRDRIIDIDAVSPEDLKYEGVVEIVRKINKICLFYVKEQDFINLVKSKSYKWDERQLCWYRNLSQETGSFEDRAAEIGHALLTKGFAICIHDSEITDKAIRGDFKKEITRWIQWNAKEKVLAIYWSERDDESYRASRKIKDNQYNYEKGCVEVPICRYRSVNNFMKKYDFCYTEEAQAAIEQYKSEQREMRRVKMSS